MDLVYNATTNRVEYLIRLDIEGSGGGSVATLNFFTSDDWDLDVTGKELDTGLTLGNAVLVFKNGVGPLEEGVGNDYTISGSVITFTTALTSTNKIAVINGNISAINLTPYAKTSDLATVATSGNYNDLTNKPNVILAPTVLTDQSTSNMALTGNTIYKWTSALTSLSFASAEVSDLETRLYFTTGSPIQFQDFSSLKWGGDGTAPSLEVNTIYCIAICNGLAEIDSFGTVS